MQFFTLDSSKIEVFETYFFHTVITQSDHPSFVKHFLGTISVSFTLFGYWAWGGGGAWGRYTTTLRGFPIQSQIKSPAIRPLQVGNDGKAGPPGYVGKTATQPLYPSFCKYVLL